MGRNDQEKEGVPDKGNSTLNILSPEEGLLENPRSLSGIALNYFDKIGGKDPLGLKQVPQELALLLEREEESDQLFLKKKQEEKSDDKSSQEKSAELEGVNLNFTWEDAQEYVGQIEEGRYQPISLIEKGGQALIILAYDQEVEREVAIKIFTKGKLEDQRKTMKLMASLEEAKAPPLYSYGEQEGRLFYVMKYLKGKNLGTILQQTEGRNLLELINLFKEICLGMQKAHEKGIIHADLKPANTMICEEKIYLIDWDLGGRIIGDQGFDGKRKIQGTVNYMAPEKFLKEPAEINERTDIYSLGAILYEILTGEEPFFDAGNIVSAIWEGKLKLPGEKRPEKNIPLELDLIVQKAMAKNKEQRYENIGLLLQNLQIYLDKVQSRQEKTREAQKIINEVAVFYNTYVDQQQNLEFRYNCLITAVQDYNNQVIPRKEELPEESEQKKWIEQRVENRKRLDTFAEEIEKQEDNLYDFLNGIITQLETVLTFDPDNENAQRYLVEIYKQKLLEAENEGNKKETSTAKSKLARYLKKDSDFEIEGKGQIEVRIQPETAQVVIFQYEPGEDRRILQAVEIKKGLSGSFVESLALGEYVLKIKQKGYKEVSYPFKMQRGKKDKIEVMMRKKKEIPDNFSHIPRGEFRSSSDPNGEFQSSVLEKIYKKRKQTELVPSFAMAKYPVTIREYLEFLNDFLKQVKNQEELTPHLPSYSANKEDIYLIFNEKEFVLIDQDKQGDSYNLEWPVFGITHDAAGAYCNWRSKKEKRKYRLPTKIEFERAALGYEGRLYPWGGGFDPSFCRMNQSDPFNPGLVPVGSCPIDESPFGLRDTAGGVSEWLSTKIEDGRKEQYDLGGGSWGYGKERSQIGKVKALASKNQFFTTVGFRLALELEEEI